MVEASKGCARQGGIAQRLCCSAVSGIQGGFHPPSPTPPCRLQVHSPTKPVLVFVASRRQTRLTALDLINHAAADERPTQFVNMTPDKLTVRQLEHGQRCLEGGNAMSRVDILNNLGNDETHWVSCTMPFRGMSTHAAVPAPGGPAVHQTVGRLLAI